MAWLHEDLNDPEHVEEGLIRADQPLEGRRKSSSFLSRARSWFSRESSKESPSLSDSNEGQVEVNLEASSKALEKLADVLRSRLGDEKKRQAEALDGKGSSERKVGQDLAHSKRKNGMHLSNGCAPDDRVRMEGIHDDREDNLLLKHSKPAEGKWKSMEKRRQMRLKKQQKLWEQREKMHWIATEREHNAKLSAALDSRTKHVQYILSQLPKDALTASWHALLFLSLRLHVFNVPRQLLRDFDLRSSSMWTSIQEPLPRTKTSRMGTTSSDLTGPSEALSRRWCLLLTPRRKHRCISKTSSRIQTAVVMLRMWRNRIHCEMMERCWSTLFKNRERWKIPYVVRTSTSPVAPFS